MNNHWEDNYVESMEQMKFTGKQQEQMVDFMVNYTGEKSNHMRGVRAGMLFGIKRLAIAVICLCMVTAGTALARSAGVLETVRDTRVHKSVSEAFKEAYNLEPDTAQIADEVGSSLGISDSCDGVSVTVDAVLGDDYNFTVIFSIEKTDGTAFEQFNMRRLADKHNTVAFRRSHIRTDKKPVGGRSATAYFYDANPDDFSFQYIYRCHTDTKGTIGAQVTASFTDLGYSNSSSEFVPIALGYWNLTFPLDYTDSARHLAADQKIIQDGKTIIVKKADISPVGFLIKLKIENLRGKNAFKEMERILKHVPLKLVLTDGREINLKKCGPGSVFRLDNGDLTPRSYMGDFREVIPIEKMKSLHIGDLTLDF